jgi:trans-aconitate 2-methyltransferase
MSVTTDTWNPQQYDRFQREREQPFFDLLAMVRPSPGMRVVDLGCGTGRPTRLLHERLGARETIGIDRSPKMLEGQTAQQASGLHFELGTIEDFPGAYGAFDLIFSNAAFHWVLDHESLLARLSRALAPGGQLAFQVPASHDEPTHVIADELAAEEPHRSALNGWRRSQPVLPPAEYARILHRLGFREPQVRLIVYPHVLATREDAIEWMKGTMLTEYARHLSPDAFDAFVRDYRSRVLAALEPTEPLFFPYKRILCWARRPA